MDVHVSVVGSQVSPARQLSPVVVLQAWPSLSFARQVDVALSQLA